ncbi:MAG: hypothetical protein AB8G96_12465 [Phycisphaerales bacterium]
MNAQLNRPAAGRWRARVATCVVLLIGCAAGVAPLVGLALASADASAAAPLNANSPADGGLSSGAIDLAGMTLSGPGGLTTITVRTLVWGAAIATLATALGWLPGRWLGRRGGYGLGGTLGRILVVLPVCVPAYVVFYAWWQAWPAGSWLFQWAVDTERVPLVRQATLAVALTAWAWPIAALCVAPAAAGATGRRETAMQLDGVGRFRRGLVALRSEWPGLLTGWAIVCVLTIGNTTSFDLAQIATLGNELRAMAAIARPGSELLSASAPAIALAIPGAVIAWCCIRPAAGIEASTAAPAPRTGIVLAVLLAAIGVLAPLGLLIVGVIGRADGRVFAELYGPGLLRSLGLAATLGLASAALVVIAAAGLTEARGVRRWVFTGLAIAWAAAALIPATTFVTGMEAVWNRGMFRSAVYTQPVVMVLAGLGRTGIIALLLARGAVAGRSSAVQAMSGLDAGAGAGSWFAAHRARLVPAAISAGMMAAVLNLSDAAVNPRLAPPGFQPFAGMLLGGMHYQRGDIVLMGLFAILGLGIIAASILGIAMAFSRGRTRLRLSALANSTAPILMLSALVGLGLGGAGCESSNGSDSSQTDSSQTSSSQASSSRSTSESTDSAFRGPSPSTIGSASDEQISRSIKLAGDDSAPLTIQRTVGQAGIRAGEFEYPRAITADPGTDRVYVIDKTARIQAFSREGLLLGGWRMPEWEVGKPTGISVAPDGRVFVADTHYHRILVFSTEGEEVMRFGGYGLEGGKFIFPTDVAFGPDGRLYVSEYGGNDRIQIFESDGTFVRSFGSAGQAIGQYDRPQAMVFNADRSRLYIADGCNHRIVVTDPNGDVIEIFGSPGLKAGQVNYPYDVNWLDRDTLIVSEFGNHRIQLFGVDGVPRSRHGGFGAEPGRLKYPWGSVRLGDRVFVLDSGNARLQIIDLADIG